MNIAVIGAGAIGSVVAGYLKKAGCDVVLVAKPEQCAVINTQGLHFTGARGEETIRVDAISKLDRDYHLVIFTVKSQDMETAYVHNCEHLDHSLILTTQNGVQADNILSVHFEREKLLSSIVMFGVTYSRAGEIVFNFEGDWIIGKPFMMNDASVREVAAVLQKAFKVVISPNIMGMKWLKLFVNFNNCIPALIGKSMQETFSDMGLCRLSILLLKEGAEIVEKAKIEIVSLPQFPVERISGLVNMPETQAAGIINKTLTTLSKEPLYGSILQSIMRNRPSEIDFINGEIVALASQLRLKAPLNGKILDMVHEVERTGKFFDADEVKKEFELSAVTQS